MRIAQAEIVLRARKRGIHLVTDEVCGQLELIGEFDTGLIHLFLMHTSASLSLNENASPDVREDMEMFLNQLVPEGLPAYRHVIEGSDDMPAHIKASLFGSGFTIPIRDGRLWLGRWQGIYLCEHRNSGGPRRLAVTVIGE